MKLSEAIYYLDSADHHLVACGMTETAGRMAEEGAAIPRRAC